MPPPSQIFPPFRHLQPLLLAWVLSLSAGAAEPLGHAAVFRRFGPAVVALKCDGYYGTGVVVDPSGLILTSTTVIPHGASHIQAFFTDGAIRNGTEVAYDQTTESILLTVAGAKDLVCMPLADTDACRVGDPVYSWGNPHGTLEHDGAISLAVGAISGIYQVASVDDQSRYVGPVIERARAKITRSNNAKRQNPVIKDHVAIGSIFLDIEPYLDVGPHHGWAYTIHPNTRTGSI